MNPPPEGSADGREGSSSVLRAVGSLLVALSGGDDSAAQRLLGDLQQGASPTTAPRASDYREYEDYREPRLRRDVAPQSQGELQGEVEFILSDARARAQRILDDSMERARELVRRERTSLTGFTGYGGVDPRAFDDLRRSIHGLVTEVRDIQQRLGRIEALLRPQAAPVRESTQSAYEPPPYEPPTYERPVSAPMYRPAHTPQPAEQTPPPSYEPPSYEPPRYEEAPAQDFPNWPSSVPPATGPEMHEARPQPAAEQPAPAPSPAPAPAPPRSSFSVVPPDRRDWSDAAAPPPEVHEPEVHEEAPWQASAAAGEPAPAEPAPTPAAWSEPAAAAPSVSSGSPGSPGSSGSSGSSGADIATFLPADGAITLRITPVAGFQGLMRVQDALARLPAVRSAAVEAYSQGEARLRVELADTTDSEELAAGLGHSLNEPAHVREASEPARQLLIALR